MKSWGFLSPIYFLNHIFLKQLTTYIITQLCFCLWLYSCPESFSNLSSILRSPYISVFSCFESIYNTVNHSVLAIHERYLYLYKHGTLREYAPKKLSTVFPNKKTYLHSYYDMIHVLQPSSPLRRQARAGIYIHTRPRGPGPLTGDRVLRGLIAPSHVHMFEMNICAKQLWGARKWVI